VWRGGFLNCWTMKGLLEKHRLMEDWEEVKKGPGWVRMLAIEADGEDC